jgi:hypothetical protein
MSIYIFLILSDGALSEFNHGLGHVESIRSPCVFGPRICAIRMICPDSIWTQFGHGLPVQQDMHPNSVRVKSLSSARTVHRIHGVRVESVRNRWPSVQTSLGVEVSRQQEGREWRQLAWEPAAVGAGMV